VPKPVPGAVVELKLANVVNFNNHKFDNLQLDKTATDLLISIYTTPATFGTLRHRLVKAVGFYARNSGNPWCTGPLMLAANIVGLNTHNSASIRHRL
jgi:hypothetical protein